MRCFRTWPWPRKSRVPPANFPSSFKRCWLGASLMPQRQLVTSHDAFGYMGQAWQLEFIAPQGLSTHDEPSAAEVAALIRQIRSEGVQAVVVENIRAPRLIQ